MTHAPTVPLSAGSLTIVSSTISISTLGATAHAALAAESGLVTVLAPLSRSLYVRAGDEIVWLGAMDATLHARAMLTPLPPEAWNATRPGDAVRLDARSATRWQPARWDPGRASRQALVAGAQALLDARAALGRADGLGALLAGRFPGFPLHDAHPRASALAQACQADDPEAAIEPAIALLGLGPGLTPSGDDFVGGAFFARAILGELDGHHAPGWPRAALRVLTAAGARTHPISGALLSDMLRGVGHAPLHTLMAVLATGAPLEAATAAARRVTRIGHSSGWDMLTGVLAGILGSTALRGPLGSTASSRSRSSLHGA